MSRVSYRGVLRTLVGAIGVSAWLAGAPVHAEGDGWRAPPRAAKVENPTKSTPDALAAAQKVWAKECAACHGDTGKGDGPQAKKLETRTPPLAAIPPQSDGELYWKVTTGRRPMPGYRKTLTDEQRWQLVHLMRTFGAR